MRYTIYRDNIKVIEVKPLSSSELSQKKTTQDYLKLDFVLSEFIDIKIGDYVFYAQNNRRYKIRKKPRLVDNPNAYRYECYFEGELHDLENYVIKFATPKDSGGFYNDYRFDLTGNAQTFLESIVQSLNNSGGSYVIGDYAETEIIDFAFDNYDALTGINAVTEALGCDWYIENGTINFDAKESNTPYVFRVGRKKGFIRLTRSRVEQEKISTIVYGYGSSENMPPRSNPDGQSYDSDLLSENRLTFEGDDGESKLSKNVDLYGVREEVKEFDIKPEFTGVVSSIDESNRRVFFDTSIDFDINDQLIGGIKPKITFLDSTLRGLTFDISFDNSSKKITMDYYTDESGQYPNDVIFPNVGDTYKIFDIAMPESYIYDASIKLKDATQDYINKQSIPMDAFEGELDPEYIQGADIKLSLYDTIRVVSPTFGIDTFYPIEELIQPVTTPYNYNVKFGEIIPRNLLSSLVYANFTTNQNIYKVSRNTVNSNTVTNIVGDSNKWE